MKTAYITTPIYYVNDAPHIGHYYSSIVADIIARSHFLSGFDVKSQTGTDEHGQKILKSANEKGVLPMAFCNEISKLFWQMNIDSNCVSSYEKFDLESFNQYQKEIDSEKYYNFGEHFIRTIEGRDLKTGEVTIESEENGRHIKFVKEFWKKLEQNGYIYKSEYSGWYAVRDEAFYQENELVDGKAPTGAEVEFRREECYFFRLSAFQKILLSIFLENKDLIQPQQKYTEVLSFLSGLNFEKASQGFFKANHLQDICISRPNLPWGIEIEENQSIYVWLDALTNYLSALSEKRDKYWNNRTSDSKVVHIVGKDILRFHAVFWPAFLIAEKISIEKLTEIAQENNDQEEQSLTKDEIVKIANSIDKNIIFSTLFAHGWWMNDGQKISKSLKNTINPMDEIAFLCEFGAECDISLDYFRYFLLRSMPFGNDGNYVRESLIETVNADLVNNIGNLVQRSLSMVVKYFPNQKLKLEEKHLNLEKFNIACKHFENLEITEAINEILAISRSANEFIDKTAPWKLAKEEKFDEILDCLLKIIPDIFAIASLLSPICPSVSQKILLNLGFNGFSVFSNATQTLLNKSFEIIDPKGVCPRLKKV